jgi:hypothetical protein
MWKHIDQDIVEKKYGGSLVNQKAPFWPPNATLMNYSSKCTPPALISREEYNRKFNFGVLANRKVKESLLNKAQKAEPPPPTPRVEPAPPPNRNTRTR